jgi:hypothetical protein
VQVEELDEVVSVRADFAGGDITPKMFKRGTTVHRIDTVNSRWQSREGWHTCHHFSVQVEDDAYVLQFSTSDMVWRIEKVVLPG